MNPDVVGTEEVAEFRLECEQEVACIQTDPDFEDYSLSDLLLGMLDGHEADDLLGPFLARVLGLSADPWPGLTLDDLARMTRGRVREAKRLGIPVVGGGSYPAAFLFKLKAAKHRAWLEQA